MGASLSSDFISQGDHFSLLTLFLLLSVNFRRLESGAFVPAGDTLLSSLARASESLNDRIVNHGVFDTSLRSALDLVKDLMFVQVFNAMASVKLGLSNLEAVGCCGHFRTPCFFCH